MIKWKVCVCTKVLIITKTSFRIIGLLQGYKYVVFLIRIREVPGSNLGPETGYSDWGFCGFSQSLLASSVMVP
jgi:hypothetical protein